MSKMSQFVAEQSLRQQSDERQEPANYERMAMSPEQEQAFTDWTKRLIPALPKEAF